MTVQVVQVCLSMLFNHIYVKTADSSRNKSDIDHDFMVL